MFGARGVGKSTLLKTSFDFEQCRFINLLDVDVRNQLMDRPDRLKDFISPNLKWVIIDEIQKIPDLLDVVHSLIEERNICFGLTGSSARKLKRGGANLLAGRAFVYNLYPFSHLELGTRFNLEDALMWGMLPKIFSYEQVGDRQRFLKAYANTYLQEEVWEEHLIKDLVPFRRFLQVAAQYNGTVLNFAKIADDTRVDDKTVVRYFQILEDTLIGFMLQPYHRSLRKRQRASPKFYFFDIGVQRALLGDFSLEYGRGSYGYGNRFEHFILCEIVKQNEYLQTGWDISFIRIDDDHEIDFVLTKPNGETIFIEIKSTDHVTSDHAETLIHVSKIYPEAELFLWSQDPNLKTFDGVTALPWNLGISKLFAL